MRENELIPKVQSGDTDAMERLIAHYYPSVFAYFYKNTNQYHRSKDLTQEVFIKMAAGIARYRLRASFKSWLFTIASNHLKNEYRSRARRPEEQALFEEIPAGGAEAARVELKNDLQTALARLPAPQREAVILRYYSGFSMKEISGITGVTETAAKARIRYGLEKLKKELEGYDEKT